MVFGTEVGQQACTDAPWNVALGIHLKKTQREARRVTDAMNNPTAKQGHSLPLQTVKLMGKLPTQY